MAKVILGPLVSDIRNKLGGMVFTKSKYGNTIRKRVKPTNPKSTLQVTNRGNFKIASQAWDALTQTLQAAWVAWAASNSTTDKFGGTKALSANAAFVRYQRLRATVGLALSTAVPGPIGAYPPAPTAAAAVSSTGVVTLTTPVQSASAGWYIVHTTPGLKAGATYAGSKQRIAGVVASAAAATTATATPAAYNPKLAFSLGSVVIVKVVQVDVAGLVAGVTSFRVVAT